MTDYSPFGSPTMAPLNSVSVEGSLRAASVFDPNPSPTSGDSRTSFISNTTGYTSYSIQQSPRATVMIPTSEPRAAPLPAISQVESVQEFIKCEPVVEVAPVSLPTEDEQLECDSPPGLLSADTPPEFDNGLMLASEAIYTLEKDTTSESIVTREPPREADCSIGPKSTFHLLQGFCNGAEAFRMGGHGQGVKQTAGYVAVSPPPPAFRNPTCLPGDKLTNAQ